MPSPLLHLQLPSMSVFKPYIILAGRYVVESVERWVCLVNVRSHKQAIMRLFGTKRKMRSLL
jgi:hypothetical protein